MDHTGKIKDAVVGLVIADAVGVPVILTIAAGAMFKAGHLFFLSENGVWLCVAVPAKYIQF